MESTAREVNVGLVGYRPMGRAHSNAHIGVGWLFRTGVTPVRRAVCGRDEAAGGAMRLYRNG